MKAIRESKGTEKERNRLLNFLGMESPFFRMRCNILLRILNERLNDARSSQQVPLTTFGHPVFEASFDPYRSALVAPDHLLSGNAINILKTCFLMISSREQRVQIDARICDGLRRNSLITQRNIFDVKNNKLYSTTISGTFCTLFVARFVF